MDKEKQTEICDRCNTKIKGTVHTNLFYLEDKTLEKFAQEKGGKKHKENYYLLCPNCTFEYKAKQNLARFFSELEKIRTKKCDNCSKILLKENSAYACYHLVYKDRKEIKNEEEAVDKVICRECWDKSTYLTIGRYWEKVIVNPDKILTLDSYGDRVSVLKIIDK